MTGRAVTVLLLMPLAACGAPVPPWPQPPAAPLELRIAVAPTEVALLEPVTVQLDLYRRRDLEVEFAPAVDPADFLVECTATSEVGFGDGSWLHRTLVLRPVRGPGELTLPSFVAKARDGSTAASTPAHTLVVRSSLDGAAAAIEPPGEPFPPPPRRAWWLAGAAALAALVALGYVGRRRRRPPAAVAVALPPHVRAQRALQRLRGAPRATPAQVEAFYVEVSGVLRTYLEERFGLHAPERTTEEFLRELETGDGLAREHRASLERFLRQCDLVKFAALVPGEAEHLATFALAEAFVETTRADRSGTEVAP